MPPPGKITGTGPALALDPAQNNTFLALNRAWVTGARVSLANARYIVSGLSTAQQDELVKSLALQAERTAAPAGAREIKRPRVGLYRPFMASMDEGWTRWMLERYGFEVVNLTPKDFRARASLADRIDSLVIADEARGLMEGYATGMMPPQFEGGIGEDGVRAIDSFVKDGGTLVCFNRATAFAIRALWPAGEERGRGHEAPGVLHGRVGARGGSYYEPPGDGRDAGTSGNLRGQQPGVRDRGGLQGGGAGEVPGHRLAAALRIPAW